MIPVNVGHCDCRELSSRNVAARGRGRASALAGADGGRALRTCARPPRATSPWSGMHTAKHQHTKRRVSISYTVLRVPGRNLKATTPKIESIANAWPSARRDARPEPRIAAAMPAGRVAAASVAGSVGGKGGAVAVWRQRRRQKRKRRRAWRRPRRARRRVRQRRRLRRRRKR